MRRFTSSTVVSTIFFLRMLEDLALDDASPVKARVEWAEFYGHDQVLGLRLPGEEVVRVRVLGNRQHTPGEEVGLTLRGAPIAYRR